MTTPENPPAFPQLTVEACEHDGHGDRIEPFTSVQGGLSMRDYFAAAALQGLLARGGEVQVQQDEVDVPLKAVYAKRAYSVANAMLVARSKP